MRRLLTSAAAAVALALGAPAASQAHWTVSEQGAINVGASAYASHCGNGITWWCGAIPAPFASRFLYYYGAHSAAARVGWTEYTLGYGRTCYVDVRIEHTSYAQTIKHEWCVR